MESGSENWVLRLFTMSRRGIQIDLVQKRYVRKIRRLPPIRPFIPFAASKHGTLRNALSRISIIDLINPDFLFGSVHCSVWFLSREDQLGWFSGRMLVSGFLTSIFPHGTFYTALLFFASFVTGSVISWDGDVELMGSWNESQE